MTPKLKRAKARVEKAAMQWFRSWKGPIVWPRFPRGDPDDERLMRACAALDKLTKGKK